MKKEVKKPNAAIYWLAAKLVGLFYRLKYHISFRREGLDEIRAPFLLLSNHICNIDFLATALAVYPQKVHMVTAAMYFRNPFLRWLLTLLGCISKEQFQVDTRAVRNILSVIRRGESAAIFPAGQSSFSGEATFIEPNIARLVRQLKVPVIAVKVQGGHIAFPKWNMKRLRKSRLDVSVKLLFRPEQLSMQEDEAIYTQIVQALYFDDYEWQRSAMIAARSPRCAEGLERLLFRCPRCHSEVDMRTAGNRLYCAACGNAARMDVYGFLQPEGEADVVFDTPTAWSRWQYAQYMELLLPEYRFEANVTLLRVMPNDQYVPVGKGKASLSIAQFCYTGLCDGEQVEWKLSNALAAIFPYEKKASFDVYFREGLYSLEPESLAVKAKFVLLKECIYRKYYLESKNKAKCSATHTE